jgi:hypothetical protein
MPEKGTFTLNPSDQLLRDRRERGGHPSDVREARQVLTRTPDASSKPGTHLVPAINFSLIAANGGRHPAAPARQLGRFRRSTEVHCGPGIARSIVEHHCSGPLRRATRRSLPSAIGRRVYDIRAVLRAFAELGSARPSGGVGGEWLIGHREAGRTAGVVASSVILEQTLSPVRVKSVVSKKLPHTVGESHYLRIDRSRQE